jgi:hypothetical protein
VHAGGQVIVSNVDHQGGDVALENRGSTPCTYLCTRPNDAEHGHGAGVLASRRR